MNFRSFRFRRASAILFVLGLVHIACPADAASLEPPEGVIQMQLNDTGYTRCADNNSPYRACSDVRNQYPGQDAEYGRDIDPLRNSDFDGAAGFSFTKLDAEGKVLAGDAGEWSCVRDNVTGLIWERKRRRTSNNNRHQGLHDVASRYGWGQTVDPGGNCQADDGTEYECSTAKFTELVNEEALCGITDWRLPVRQELHSLRNYNTAYPAVDTRFFGDMASGSYMWTSNRLPVVDALGNLGVGTATESWGVNITSAQGTISPFEHTRGLGVMLVSGQKASWTHPERFEILEETDEVIDHVTGLAWQRFDSSKHTWQDTLNNEYEWEDKTGKGPDYKWRLPNIKELDSIVSLDIMPGEYEDGAHSWRFKPLGNIDHGKFWTSSSEVKRVYSAWVVDFSSGRVITGRKVRVNYTRASEYGSIRVRDYYTMPVRYQPDEETDNDDFTDDNDEDNEEPIPINTEPLLFLEGEEEITLYTSDTFEEPGFNATDAEDGELTSNVEVRMYNSDKHTVLSIDTSSPSEYEIEYRVSDSNGSEAVKTRKVVVLPKPELLLLDEEGFADTDGTKRGVDKVKATANEEEVTFKVLYRDEAQVQDIKNVRVEARIVAHFATLFTEAGKLMNPAVEYGISTRTAPTGSMFIELDSPQSVVQLNIAGTESSSDFELRVFSSNDQLLQTVSVAASDLTGDKTENIIISSENDDIQSIEIVNLINKNNPFSITKWFFAKDHEMTRGDTEQDETSFSLSETLSQGSYSYSFKAINGIRPLELVQENFEFETGYSNVVFLPGIQSSRLYLQEAKDGVCINCENQLWEPIFSGDAMKLNMNENSNGLSEIDNIYTKDVVDEVFGAAFLPNIYKTFLIEMSNWKEDGLVNEVTAIPYDWRYDFDHILSHGVKIGNEIHFSQASRDPYIIKEIERMIDTSANGRVTIIAHSMGGLVAKRMFSNLAKEVTPRSEKILHNTENLILVASPQLGTPKAIASLLHGYKQDVLLVAKKPAIRLGRYMPSAYNLLPSNKYMNSLIQGSDYSNEDYNNVKPITFHYNLRHLEDSDRKHLLNYHGIYGDAINSLNEYFSFLRGDEGREEFDLEILGRFPIKLSNTLLENSIELHEDIDNWTPPETMSVIQIAGWGVNTMRGIEYYAKCIDPNKTELDQCPLQQRILGYDALFTFDGDETVVSPSAIAMKDVNEVDTIYLDLYRNNENQFVSNTHASILEAEDLGRFLLNIVNRNFKKNNSDLDSYNYLTRTKPEHDESYIHLKLNANANITVTDNTGNTTGAYHKESQAEVKGFTESIPNSYYTEFGDKKYTGAPKKVNPAIEMTAAEDGLFTLKIKEAIGDTTVHSAEFTNIPLTAISIATVDVTAGDNPVMLIDGDGDGETDATIESTTENVKQNPVQKLEVISALLIGTNMEGELQEKLLRKLMVTETKLQKGKQQKAVKRIHQIIKRLEREIKRNTRFAARKERVTAREAKILQRIEDAQEQIGEEGRTEVLEEITDKKELKKLKRQAKKDARLQARIQRLENKLAAKKEQWAKWEQEHLGIRVKSDDAQTLILFLENLVTLIDSQN
jgi:hypothetical protein